MLLDPLDADPSAVPFSRRGAWTCFGAIEMERYQPFGPGLYWRSNRMRSFIQRELFRFVLERDGKPVEAVYRFYPHFLEMLPADGGAGSVRIAYAGADSIRIRGEGIGLMVESRRGAKVDPVRFMIVAQPLSTDRWSVNYRSALRRYGWERVSGEMRVETDWDGQFSSFVEFHFSADPGAEWEVAADEYGSTWIAPPRQDFDTICVQAGQDFADFAERFLLLPVVDSEARRLAIYTLWMNMVEASGWLHRPAMLMSRNWMDQVWSWDNMFNGAALAFAHPKMADDQWLLMFELQDEHGALPDAVSDQWLHYNFSKPPVQGLLYSWTQRLHPGYWNAERNDWFYEHTAAFTCWWLSHRRFPGRRLCHYLHGNDSGWDNTTLLREGAPIESPDLNSFLIWQCRILADLAYEAGDRGAAQDWQAVADELQAALLEELWDGNRFTGYLPMAEKVVAAQSLVTLMPLVLGQSLPVEVRAALLTQLDDCLTEFGPATEMPTSEFYQADGYWRGPIWGPSTLLIVHGLMASGEIKRSREVALRFLRLCEMSGFAENFDALTGAPLRDLNYTWTASAFLELAAFVQDMDAQRGPALC